MQFLAMFKQAGESIIEKSQQLSELDMIGDADFGINVSGGFEKIRAELSSLQDPDIGTILAASGQVFVFDVGSTIGALIGRAFQRAGKQFQGKRKISAQEFVMLLATVLTTIQEVGGAKPGDKTLVDALQPAVKAANDAVKSGVTSVHSILEVAVEAAEQGAKSTASMVAKIGRASYLGKRSLGAIDPGAMFIYVFLDAMSKALHD